MVLLDLPELVTVTKDEVHVFVEGLERPDEDAAVLQDAPHPEVDVLQHLAALSHRLHTNNDTSGQRGVTGQKSNFVSHHAMHSTSPLNRKPAKWLNPQIQTHV